MEPRTKKHS
ncbi:hypothetical protein IEO21_11225 [Rhodonia placenta]|uniref:Uncharacterized protein n=1 Tax=Rhodonia placenta TaxID=104341 RepID=A0A8H7TWR3_9APHY|nr:hypothetical protein IEO21_11225 [Postia placenta]